MQLDPPPRRLPAEPYLPLINIVFLLLIFFLIAARLAPAPPLQVMVPKATDGQSMAGRLTLYLAADGRLAHLDARDDAAISALAQTLAKECPPPCRDAPRLLLYVDAQAPAARLAAVLPQLASIGWGDIQLVTEKP